MKIKIIFALIVIVSLLFSSMELRAEEVSSVTTSLSIAVHLQVNGKEFYTQRVSVSPPARVCVLNLTIPIGQGIREVFKFWTVNGEVLSSEPCIDVSETGNYVATYKRQYLIQIDLGPGVESKAFWIDEGETLKYDAPMNITLRNTYYYFLGWEGGYVSEGRTIYVPASQPTNVVAVYVPHYPLYINGSLVGHYPTGYLYLYNAEVMTREKERIIVKDLIVTGGKVSKTGYGYLISIEGSTHIYPVTEKEYLVTIKSVMGTHVEWVREGEYYTVKAQKSIELDGEKYVFEGWVGSINTSSPTYSFRVDKPMDIEAKYVRQYKIEIISPTGEKTRYAAEGSTIYIYEPPELPAVVTSRVLEGFLVNGKEVKPYALGVLKIDNVSEPITVVAIYVNSVMWINIAIIAGMIALFIAGYLLYGYIRKGSQ